MLFNSIEFIIFLPLIFGCYWLIPNRKLSYQNLFILVASYFFYGWWDWKFLGLILFSTIVDYSIGIFLSRSHKKIARKLLLWISILVNIGLLGFFKYYNFFIENFTLAFNSIGIHVNQSSLDIILPVGISFYTFQTLSYTIDVYRQNIKATHSFLSFAAFVSFFPQLVAGPIERASHLLPQFENARKFDYKNAVNGMRQILWGLFKKIVIADNAAEIVNQIYSQSGEVSGNSLALAAFFFAFQIYGDFSGYSDIAIGTARLFGFDLKQNFAFPYFSRNIAEFWRRWHISLSTWFRDYLYIPLGGSKGNTLKKIRNTFIIFLVSGFWHGANWTFIVWGALNALFFLPLLLTEKNRKYMNNVSDNSNIPPFKVFMQIIFTFSLTCVAWIFFRADSVQHAFEIINRIFSKSLIQYSGIDFVGTRFHPLTVLVLICLFILVEWLGRRQQFAIEHFRFYRIKSLKYGFYYLILIAIFWFNGSPQEFIYFQF